MTKQQVDQTMTRRLSLLRNLALLMGGVLVLNACSAISDSLGANKYPPDEFAVVAKTPLIIPPDFNMQPPGIGNPQAREVDTSELAMRAMFPEPEAAPSGTASPAEFQLLQSSGATQAGPDARSNLEPSNNVVRKGTATEEFLYGEPVGGMEGGPIDERDSVPDIDR